MIEVEGTEEFEVWFLALAEKEAEAIARVVGLLEEKRRGARLPIQQRHQGITGGARA